MRKWILLKTKIDVHKNNKIGLHKLTYDENNKDILIIIMVIFKCYFSGEHIALSIKKQQQKQQHRIRKNQQIKSTVHDAN